MRLSCASQQCILMVLLNLVLERWAIIFIVEISPFRLLLLMLINRTVRLNAIYVLLLTACKLCLLTLSFLLPSGAGPFLPCSTSIIDFQPLFFLLVSLCLRLSRSASLTSLTFGYKGASALFLFLQNSILRVAHIVMRLFLLGMMRIVLGGTSMILRVPVIFLVILFSMNRFLDIFLLHIILSLLPLLIPTLLRVLFILVFVHLMVRPLLILFMLMMSPLRPVALVWLMGVPLSFLFLIFLISFL